MKGLPVDISSETIELKAGSINEALEVNNRLIKLGFDNYVINQGGSYD